MAAIGHVQKAGGVTNGSMQKAGSDTADRLAKLLPKQRNTFPGTAPYTW